MVRAATAEKAAAFILALLPPYTGRQNKLADLLLKWKP